MLIEYLISKTTVVKKQQKKNNKKSAIISNIIFISKNIFLKKSHLIVCVDVGTARL